MTNETRKSASSLDAETGLTHKQQRFVNEYLIDLNAKQAAIRSGYSAKSAEVQGVRLLSYAKVQQAIDAGRKKQAEKTGLSAERVIQEAMRLAFFDIRKLTDAEGNPIPISQLDDDTAAAIQGLELATEKARDSDGALTVVRKYKVADKNSAIERLFRHLGLFKEDNKQNNPGDAMANFMAELSARGSRLPIKKADNS